jgi:hypothetical protein
VPGVDDPGRAGVQVDAQELAGDELAGRRVLGEAVVGVAGLLGEAEALSAAVAQAADQQGGQQGSRDVVADRVGDRHLQEVPVELVVEGVPAHRVGRFQPSGEGELPGLAGEGGRQQSALDLRGQGERGGAHAPLEHVGVPAGVDEEVGQRVCGAADVGDLLGQGSAGQHQFEQTNSVAAGGDRHDHPGAVADRLHIGLLCPQDAVIRSARQWHRLGLLDSATASSVDPFRGRQPDDCPAAEVGDQQVHLAGADHLREPGRDHRDRVDRRRRLHAVEEFADVDPASPRPAHGADPSRTRSRRVACELQPSTDQRTRAPRPRGWARQNADDLAHGLRTSARRGHSRASRTSSSVASVTGPARCARPAGPAPCCKTARRPGTPRPSHGRAADCAAAGPTATAYRAAVAAPATRRILAAAAPEISSGTDTAVPNPAPPRSPAVRCRSAASSAAPATRRRGLLLAPVGR